MRSGAEYREALKDGRRVWVLGEGPIEDVTTHPATQAMVEEYALWYDRHRDPAWRDTLFGQSDAAGARRAWAYALPKSAEDLAGMGHSFAATCFATAGNITHTPAYGNLIALGVQSTVEDLGRYPQQIAAATRYRDEIAASGRFLTFCGGAPTIGARLRPDPKERIALRVVREKDNGIVLSGKVGMHTSPAFAEDVYIGALCGIEIGGERASFVVPVSAAGVTTVCRKIAARPASRFAAPLSSRYDELDGQMWLEEVFVPWERIFFVDPSPEPIVRWLIWHHLYGWLAKGEFTLGLALACVDALALKEHPPTIEYLMDLVVEVETARSCLIAAERDPVFTAAGHCCPNHLHLTPGGIAILKARQRMAELLRLIPGSSFVLAPTDADLAAPEMAAGLEEAFGGGGYTAAQRAALLQMAADHVSSALDGRESAFELHASGGIPAWRGRLRQNFGRWSELANAVLQQLDLPMPEIDLSAIGAAPLPARRVVTPPTPGRNE